MGELIMGRHSYGTLIRRGTGNTVTIGKYCSLAEGVVADGGFGHNTKFVSTYPFNQKFDQCKNLTGHPVIKGDINIGNDVWIGEGATIMSGVTIGHGAIIGMRSIVSKDVQPYTIIVGAPQKVLRKRFTDDQIQKLLKIKWWNLSDSEVANIAPLLMNEDVQKLLNHFGYDN